MVVVFASVLCCIIPRTQKFRGDLQSGGANIPHAHEIEFELSGSGGRYGEISGGQPAEHNRSWRRLQANLATKRALPLALSQGRGSEDSERKLVQGLHGGSDGTGSSSKAREGMQAGNVHRRNSESNWGRMNVILQTAEFSVRVDSV